MFRRQKRVHLSQLSRPVARRNILIWGPPLSGKKAMVASLQRCLETRQHGFAHELDIYVHPAPGGLELQDDAVDPDPFMGLSPDSGQNEFAACADNDDIPDEVDDAVEVDEADPVEETEAAELEGPASAELDEDDPQDAAENESLLDVNGADPFGVEDSEPEAANDSWSDTSDEYCISPIDAEQALLRTAFGLDSVRRIPADGMLRLSWKFAVAPARHHATQPARGGNSAQDNAEYFLARLSIADGEFCCPPQQEAAGVTALGQARTGTSKELSLSDGLIICLPSLLQPAAYAEHLQELAAEINHRASLGRSSRLRTVVIAITWYEILFAVGRGDALSAAQDRSIALRQLRKYFNVPELKLALDHLDRAARSQVAGHSDEPPLRVFVVPLSSYGFMLGDRAANVDLWSMFGDVIEGEDFRRRPFLPGQPVTGAGQAGGMPGRGSWTPLNTVDPVIACLTGQPGANAFELDEVLTG